MADRTLLQSGRVLVVDDDSQVRDLIARLLKGAGWQVGEASSGEQALEMLKSAPADLILLDIQMPGMSGHEVLEALRTSQGNRLLPVIMLTGAGTRKDKLRAIEAGVTDFIAKPFDPEELIARVAMTADIYDALTSDRVYRAAVPRERALEIMAEEARKGWRDARLLDEFKGVLEKVPEGLPG